MTRAYYNEIDPFAAAWLRNLIAAGHIAPGDVDERSIEDVRPEDVRGYTQCHWFAGLGGWSYALRLAGWPDDRAIWTGSCPCQPFSSAGRRGGTDDARHLWPAWFRLIRECAPVVVFGEQVASKDGLAWFDAVHADLEGAGYAVGAVDCCAAGVGAPHIRQRLWFVADAERGAAARHGLEVGSAPSGVREEAWEQRVRADARDGGGARGLADTPDGDGRSRERAAKAGTRKDEERRRGLASGRAPGAVDHADGVQSQQPPGTGAGPGSAAARGACRQSPGPGATRNPWSSPDWLPCRDGKARPAQSGIFPLVDGVSGGRVAVGRAVQQAIPALSREEADHVVSRVGVLRGAGNAIVAPLAAEFIRAYLTRGRGQCVATDGGWEACE